MKKATLKNVHLEEELCTNGYLLIKNFLNGGEVGQILHIYRQHHPVADEEIGMWNSLYNLNMESGLNISSRILEILKPRLNSIFDIYYAPLATFMSKNCNENSKCDLHRDFSIVDETQFQYRNVWIPLVGTNNRNGALYVIKGSNNVFNYVLPMFCEWPYKFMQSKLFESIETIECNAGDLVIYLDQTLHGSHINHSDDSRPVVHFGILHPDVQLLFYFLDKSTDKIRTYEVPFQFYFENNFSEPIGRYPLHSEFDYSPPSIGIEEIQQKLSMV